jgi:type VI secretion system protein ImpK
MGNRMAIDSTPQQRSFLLTRFREFYREVVRLRRLMALPVTSGIGEDRRFLGLFDLNASPHGRTGAWQELLTILERQAVEAGQAGGAFAFEVYREAQYLMAALADDIFLSLDKSDPPAWPLLETRLFGTHMAGETVFRRLDLLLQRRDPFYLDLASVYFMALSLGFQGKFRGAADQAPLVQYRRQLFAMIYGRHPKLFSEDARLFPQAYQNTMDKGEGRLLPDQRLWLALIAAVLLVWVVVSHVAWSGLSTPVEAAMCRVTNDCAVEGSK